MGKVRVAAEDGGEVVGAQGFDGLAVSRFDVVESFQD